ncbi:MAG: enolase C-terminal domain-like protein [Opitutaceae bacterium]
MSARIAALETWIARYPVVGDFKYLRRAADGPVTRDTVVVKLTDDAGRSGWGQSVPSPTWSYETIETVSTTLTHHLGPALVGLDVDDTATVWRTMNRVIANGFSTGQPIAKAGIDLALFDLVGRARGETPCQRWGADGKPNLTLSWTVDARSIDEVAGTVATALTRGYRAFNLKAGAGLESDLAIARELRRVVPGAFIWADANGAYDEASAVTLARTYADLGFAAFEQPLPANRLPGYLTLKRMGALPILMDEGVVSLEDLRSFHQLGLLDGVAMKVSRSGGLTEARRMIAYLRDEGLHYFASGLTDPDLALAACLHLFAATDLPHPAALNAPQFLSGSILATPLVIHGDQAYVPNGPGLGVDVAHLQPQ